MVWSIGWLGLAAGVLGLETAAMVKNRQGTLSSTIERLTVSRGNKAIAVGAMFGFVAWFAVHLGLV